MDSHEVEVKKRNIQTKKQHQSQVFQHSLWGIVHQSDPSYVPPLQLKNLQLVEKLMVSCLLN